MGASFQRGHRLTPGAGVLRPSTKARMATVQNSKADTLAPGYQLDTYQIEAVLGQGGFGITYKARDVKLGAEVAIKEYFPTSYAVRQERSTIVPRTSPVDADNYRWGLAEFLKEAQALAKFKHAHIVRVLRFFEANGTAYMVMEYEKGETLAGFVRRHGGFVDEPTLLRIFLPVLSGLQAVHDTELLHLDIKPENIYLRADGTPMLIDFGSARQIRGDDAQKIMLTPGYAAIEQYPGHGDIGAWSDVYSIGATLYRCITNEQPIDSLQRFETFKRNRMDPMRPATSFERPSYAAHIRKCVDAALSLSAGDRPASAYILQQGLMGKDMSLVGKPSKQTVYRPGTGFIGVVPAATTEVKKRAGRSTFERVVALLVFVATMAVVIPKLLVALGYYTEDEMWELLEDRKQFVAAQATNVRDFVNEKIFLQPPRPKTTAARVALAERVRAKSDADAQAAAAQVAAPATPYSVGKRLVKEFTIPDNAPIALGFLKHGAIVAIATDDGLVRLWDVQAAEPRLTLSTNVRTPAALGIFPSSQWVAVSTRNDAIALYDVLGNTELTLQNDPPHPIVALAVSPNNRLIAEASDTHHVQLWEPFQNRHTHRLTAAENDVRALAFSSDEKILAVGAAGGGVTLWESETGKQIWHRRHHAGAITSLQFSADGRYLASGGERGFLLLWDLKHGTLPRPLSLVPNTVHALAFSTDSRWLIAAGTDKSVRVWNVETGEPAASWPAHQNHIIALAITADGRRLATVSTDRVVRVWE
jgi:serine/threonine protein kinase